MGDPFYHKTESSSYLDCDELLVQLHVYGFTRPRIDFSSMAYIIQIVMFLSFKLGAKADLSCMVAGSSSGSAENTFICGDFGRKS